MLFLVTGENIDSGYLIPPHQVTDIVEQAILPSFQALAAMQNEGKVRGGVFPGERAGGFVIEVDSYEELDSIMNHLPFFGLVKWTVKPLMSFESISHQLPTYIADLRAQIQAPSS